MKVAIFTETFLPNKDGVVTSILSTIKALRERGIEVVVFTPGDETKLEVMDGARVYYIKGRPFRPYPDYKVVNPTKLAIRLLTLLEIERPDVYHIMSPFSFGVFGLVFARKFRKPTVGTFHTYLEEYTGYLFNGRFREGSKKILGTPSWVYFRTVFNRCNLTIAPTKELASVLKKKGFKRVKALSNPVDFDKFKGVKLKDIRKKHKIPKDAILLLYVGRVTFEKKLDVLFDALKEINRRDVYLLVVGKGPFLKQYKKYVKENEIKNVKFVGYVKDEDLGSYYNSCDIFVSPSDTETQGLTFVEAMYFGKPVIGANKLGVKDLIRDGKNGFKFRPGDPQDLKSKLEKLISSKSLRAKMGKKSKQYSKMYSKEKIVGSLLRIYKTIKYKDWKDNKAWKIKVE